jgi:hypothetical protein
MHRIRARSWVLFLPIFAAAAGAAQLTQDPLTQLPLPAITETIVGNSPTEMPAAMICSSQFHGNYYSLHGPLDGAVAWYVGALKGFRHVQSPDHSTHVFADAQRSIVVIVMGRAGGDADSAAYEKYAPGIPEKALMGFITHSVDCRP